MWGGQESPPSTYNLNAQQLKTCGVVSAPHTSEDILIVPLTSKTTSLLSGEFILTDGSVAGLNVETAVKRGVYTVHQNLVVKLIGQLTTSDVEQLEQSLRDWLGM